MKLFIDSGNLKEIESLVPLGIIDGITTNPSLLAKEPGDYREILKKICQIVQGSDERRGRRDRLRGHDPRGPRPRRHRPAHRRQGAVHEGRREGVQDAVVGRQARQRDALLLADAGADCRQGRRDLHQPVRRPSRRHRHVRDESHPGDRRDLRQLRVQDRSARRLDPRPDPHRRGGAPGRRHLHVSGGRHRGDVQASAHRHRAREVPEGLGKGAEA